MEVIITGFALAIAILPWAFFGYTLACLDNRIEDLEDEIENLGMSIERLNEALRNQK